MTPDEVLIQQQLAYEALSLSTRAPPPDPHVAAVKQTSLEGSEVTGKRSKKEENILSFQVMTMCLSNSHFELVCINCVRIKAIITHLKQRDLERSHAQWVELQLLRTFSLLNTKAPISLNTLEVC